LLAATAPSKICLIPEPVFGVEGVGMDVIPKLEPRIMRYELSDYEWAAIKPLLPNEPRGVPLVDDRRVLNVIFWALRSGAPWRDLLDSFGPYATWLISFVRWRRRVGEHPTKTKSQGTDLLQSLPLSRS
jgi:hypothetical protein